jgi:hypothetical protein
MTSALKYHDKRLKPVPLAATNFLLMLSISLGHNQLASTSSVEGRDVSKPRMKP